MPGFVPGMLALGTAGQEPISKPGFAASASEPYRGLRAATAAFHPGYCAGRRLNT